MLSLLYLIFFIIIYYWLYFPKIQLVTFELTGLRQGTGSFVVWYCLKRIMVWGTICGIFRYPYLPYLLYLVWVHRAVQLWLGENKCIERTPDGALKTFKMLSVERCTLFALSGSHLSHVAEEAEPGWGRARLSQQLSSKNIACINGVICSFYSLIAFYSC